MDVPMLEELTLHLQDLDDRPDLADDQRYAPAFVASLEQEEPAEAVVELCNALVKHEKTVALDLFFVIANVASALDVADEEWMQLRSMVPPEEWIALRDQNEQNLSSLLDALKESDTSGLITREDYERVREAHFTNQTAGGLEFLCDRLVESNVRLTPKLHKQLVDLLDDWRVDDAHIAATNALVDN